MFARTKRLTLRPGWPEDAAAVTAAIAHETVVSRLEQVPWPYALADAAWWLAVPRQAPEMACLVLDHEAKAPRLVGCVGLHPREGELLLGYWYTPDAWGRGYATEAGRAVVDIARHALGVRRLGSRYHVDNPASGRVLAKLGFRPTGEVRAIASHAQGRDVPTAMMALDLSAEQASPLAA